MNYTQLSCAQRYQMSALLKMGHNRTEIAAVIGKHKSTVSRELKRNKGQRGYGYLLNDTPRAELFRAIRTAAKGYSNKEISKELRISTAMVKIHLIHIYNKLGVDDRTAAVTTALEKGNITL